MIIRSSIWGCGCVSILLCIAISHPLQAKPPLAGKHPSQQIQSELAAMIVEAQAATDQITDDDEKAQMLCSLANAMHAIGDLSAARKTLIQARFYTERIANNETKAIVLRDNAQSFVEAGDQDAARQALRDSVEVASIGSNSREAIAGRDYQFSLAVQAQAALGDIDGAIEIARQITDQRMMSIALGVAAEGQIKSGDLAGARRTIEDIDGHEKSQILIEIAYAELKAGKRDDARKTIDAAATIARAIHRQTDALQGVAICQAYAGDIAGAFRSVDLIDGDFMKAEPLAAIADQQAKTGDFAGALKTAARIKDFEADCETRQAIANAAAKLGKTREAHDIEADVHMRAMNAPGQAVKFRALLKIASRQIEAKRNAAALKTLHDTLAAAISAPDASSELIRVADRQVQAEDTDAALKTLSLCDDNSFKVDTLQEIAALQIKMKDLAAARRTLKIAGKVVQNALLDSAASSDYDYITFSTTAIMQHQMGDESGGLKSLSRLRQKAEQIPEALKRSYILSTIVFTAGKALTADAGNATYISN